MICPRAQAFAVALGLAMAGCAAPSPPAPPVYGAARADGPGYADRRFEARRHRVSYRGDRRTDRETVEAYLLFRAAELTLAEGHDHFRILRQDVTPEITHYGARPGVGVGFGVGGWSSRRHDRRSGRRHGSGLGVGVGFPLGDPYGYPAGAVARSSTRWEAVAEIVLYPGPKPADAIDAYDARDVILNLRDTVRRAP